VTREMFSTKSNDIVNDYLLYVNCVVSDSIYRRNRYILNQLKRLNNSIVIWFNASQV